MSVLSIDFETRATVDLRKTGVYPYAAHHDTSIMCMAWAFDDEEPEIWTPGACGAMTPLPTRVFSHIHERGEIRAWNAAFERAIWREIMHKRWGHIAVRDDQFVCSMAEAAAMGLPLALDLAANVIGVKERKDTDGYGLMMRMTKPRKVHEDGTITWWDDEPRKQRLYEYCKQDVRVERAVVKALRRLQPKERQLYLLDQKINDRGVRIDLPLVIAAQHIVNEGTARADAALAEITDGEVTEVTNHGALTKWVRSEGVETTGVSKDAIREMLSSDLAPNIRAALEIRSEAGRASVAKLERMKICAGADDRIRGILQFLAAGTGRWGGRLIQPQNFPRGDVADVEEYIENVLAGEYDLIDLAAPPVVVVSSMLRYMLIPDDGKLFFAGDYSGIEARIVNWLAGQDDILKLFADGKDVYKYNAARLFNIPLSQVQKFPHRQTGKFQELGCGFQMGWKKAIESANTAQYGYLKLSPERAKEIVKNYRDTHAMIVQFWRDAEDAVKAAIARPGEAQTFGALRNLKAVVAGAYLFIKLPSGRFLAYAAPKVEEMEAPWSVEARNEAREKGEPLPEKQMKPTIVYYGIDSMTKKWGKLKSYGGHLVENIVQATARDVMAEGMLRMDAQFPIVLTVHDEIVSELEDYPGAIELFEEALKTPPDWASGLPIAVETWKGPRYRK